MSIDSAPGINSILCVSVDNSPLSGVFLADPGAPSIEALSSPAVARGATYNPPSRSAQWAPVTLAEVAGQYVAGARVQAAVASASGAAPQRPVSSGWWALPAPDANGQCGSAPTDFARVRTAVAPRQCARAPALLSPATCEAWGSARLLGDLRLATGPGQNPSPLTAPQLGPQYGWVGVATGAVWAGNAATGLSVPSGSGALAASQQPAFSVPPGGGCTCSGVVTAIAYTVSFNGLSGAITGATADLVVANVTLSAADCAASAVSAPLTVSLAWVDSAAPAPAPALERSGAPGYALGAPVLAGVLITQSGAAPAAAAGSDKLAIARGVPANSRLGVFGSEMALGVSFSAAGLALRGPAAGGVCAAPLAGAGVPAFGSAGLDGASVVPVTFGEDVSVSCTVALDAVALGALCAAAAGAPPGYMGFWPVNASGALAALPTHVGMLGNAHPWKAWQWAGISAPAAYPPAPVAFDANNGVCTGVPATLAVEFLWASVGESGNPQSRILGVRYRYISDSWALSREDVRTTAPAAPQTFAFATTVTWTQYGSSAPVPYVAPAPNVLPTLPSDLWFPFGGAGN